MIATILTTVTQNDALLGLIATLTLFVCAYATTIIQERLKS